MDDLLLKEINNYNQDKSNLESKGTEVEHPMKEKLKQLLPEDFEILGKINILISIDGDKKKVLNKTFKVKKEMTKKELSYLENFRNLLSYDGQNPYDRIVEIEKLPKESLSLNIKGDYSLLSVTSLSKQDIFSRTKNYISILIYKELKRIPLLDATTGIEEKKEIKLFGKKIV